ncbi:MAG: ABC-F family ATP-binding cassette domain-containing protein [Phycisphaerales bacterium]
MPVLSCNNVLVRFGDDIILDGVALSIEANDRIGLVGRNGSGKSTLMKVLCGIVKPDLGMVSLQRGSRVGYLQQDPSMDPEETLKDAAERAFETLHELHAQMHKVYDDMAHAQGDALDVLMKKQMVLEEQIEAAGGYALDHRIEEVLHGLGFTDAQMGLKVKNLSGGQKGRLALARLLLESPDIMLLDEPTNHLDIEGRIWLEDYLNTQYQGAVLMVSHDRYLLDSVVNKIIETEQGRLIDYPGNYAKFRELRKERREVMLRAYESQQEKFKKEEEYIRRFKAGQRARQAKGRETRLDREKESNTLERPMELSAFNITLPKAERTGDIVVSARGLSKKYPNDDGGEKILFDDLTLSIERGERWGIIGPNGAGKTTLIRCLLADLSADSGVAKLGSNVKIGYYRQTHEGLPTDVQVWRYIQNVILKEAPTASMSEQAARDLAGAFLFSGDEQEKQLGMLSGGERSRAVLAGLLASAKNLIVLDEPTNHLDIPSAERLEEAMREENGYNGTLLLISHDRALIDATCDHLLVLDGHGGAEVFLGNYTEWKRKDNQRKAAAAKLEAEAKYKREEADRHRKAAEERKKSEAANTTKVAQAAAPASTKWTRMKTEQIERRIEEIETRIRQIDKELSNPSVWQNHEKGNALGEERRKLEQEKEPLDFEWLRRAQE